MRRIVLKVVGKVFSYSKNTHNVRRLYAGDKVTDDDVVLVSAGTDIKYQPDFSPKLL